MKYLYIAEKRSVMDKVKAVYDRHKQEIVAKLGGEIDFFALSGHVCTFKQPQEYPQWSGYWSQVPLPMIPDPFEITIIKYQNNEKETQRIAGLVDRIKNALASGCYSTIITATDSDDQGNLIAEFLYRYLGIYDKYNILRFFETALTENSILDSLYHMTDFKTFVRDVRMTNAALARAKFDWTIGMNCSRAVTFRCSGLVMQVGRVKAPTLKLCYDNDNAIRNFKPHTDYEIKAIYKEGFTGLYVDEKGVPVDFETKEKAQAMTDYLNQFCTANVESVERKIKKTAPPPLYSLSDLQVDAGKKYNFSPSQVMEFAESLYMSEYTQYPRTSAHWVNRETADKFPKFLKSAAKDPVLTEFVNSITPADIESVKNNKNVVNDEKVNESSHVALVNTEKAPDWESLSPDLQNIYDLVCRRFVAQFLPLLEEEKGVLLSKIDDYVFKTTTSSIRKLGWRALYKKKENSEDTIPPEVSRGTTLQIAGFEIHEKVAKPAARLNQATLIYAMEHIANYIDDPELKKVMKDAKGIGTEATRATTISDLIKKGQLISKGEKNELYITESGRMYVEALKGFSIIEASEAAKWETVFDFVRQGKIDPADATTRTNAYIHKFLDEIGYDPAVAATIRRVNPNSPEMNHKMNCPFCGKAVRILKWGYACSDSQSSACNFKVSNYNGNLTPTDMEMLLAKGATRIIKNACKKKDGTFCDAQIILGKKGDQYPTSFKFPAKKK